MEPNFPSPTKAILIFLLTVLIQSCLVICGSSEESSENEEIINLIVKASTWLWSPEGKDLTAEGYEVFSEHPNKHHTTYKSKRKNGKTLKKKPATSGEPIVVLSDRHEHSSATNTYIVLIQSHKKKHLYTAHKAYVRTIDDQKSVEWDIYDSSPNAEEDYQSFFSAVVPKEDSDSNDPEIPQHGRIFGKVIKHIIKKAKRIVKKVKHIIHKVHCIIPIFPWCKIPIIYPTTERTISTTPDEDPTDPPDNEEPRRPNKEGRALITSDESTSGSKEESQDPKKGRFFGHIINHFQKKAQIIKAVVHHVVEKKKRIIGGVIDHIIHKKKHHCIIPMPWCIPVIIPPSPPPSPPPPPPPPPPPTTTTHRPITTTTTTHRPITTTTTTHRPITTTPEPIITTTPEEDVTDPPDNEEPRKKHGRAMQNSNEEEENSHEFSNEKSAETPQRGRILKAIAHKVSCIGSLFSWCDKPIRKDPDGDWPIPTTTEDSDWPIPTTTEEPGDSGEPDDPATTRRPKSTTTTTYRPKSTTPKDDGPTDPPDNEEPRRIKYSNRPKKKGREMYSAEPNDDMEPRQFKSLDFVNDESESDSAEIVKCPKYARLIRSTCYCPRGEKYNKQKNKCVKAHKKHYKPKSNNRRHKSRSKHLKRMRTMVGVEEQTTEMITSDEVMRTEPSNMEHALEGYHHDLTTTTETPTNAQDEDEETTTETDSDENTTPLSVKKIQGKTAFKSYTDKKNGFEASESDSTEYAQSGSNSGTSTLKYVCPKNSGAVIKGNRCYCPQGTVLLDRKCLKKEKFTKEIVTESTDVPSTLTKLTFPLEAEADNYFKTLPSNNLRKRQAKTKQHKKAYSSEEGEEEKHYGKALGPFYTKALEMAFQKSEVGQLNSLPEPELRGILEIYSVGNDKKSGHPLFESQTIPFTGLMNCEFEEKSFKNFTTGSVQENVVNYFLHTLRAQCEHEIKRNTLHLFQNHIVSIQKKAQRHHFIVELNFNSKLLGKKVLNSKQWEDFISAIFLSKYSEAFSEQKEKLDRGLNDNFSPGGKRISTTVRTLTVLTEKTLSLLKKKQFQRHAVKITISLVRTITALKQKAIIEEHLLQLFCKSCHAEKAITTQDIKHLDILSDYVIYGTIESIQDSLSFEEFYENKSHSS